MSICSPPDCDAGRPGPGVKMNSRPLPPLLPLPPPLLTFNVISGAGLALPLPLFRFKVTSGVDPLLPFCRFMTSSGAEPPELP